MTNQENLLVNDKELGTIKVSHKRFTSARIIKSKIENLEAKMLCADGLLIEHSTVGVSALSIIIRNMIIGPDTVIENSHLKNVKIRNSHSVLTSTFKNTIFYNCLFEKGIYNFAQFDKCAFVDTIFSENLFKDSLFKGCSFSGCAFYKNAWNDIEGWNRFLNCDFRPSQALGYLDKSIQSPSMYTHMYVRNNFFTKGTRSGMFIFCVGQTGVTFSENLPGWLLNTPVTRPSSIHNQTVTNYSMPPLLVGRSKKAYVFSTKGVR